MTLSYKVEDLVPHSGRMSFLTHITDYGDDWLTAQVVITSESMFITPLGVPSWVGLEYLAQAIGAYAGLQERLRGDSPKVGFLVGTRKYKCSHELFSIGATLDIKVVKYMQDESGLSVFDCSLTGAGYEASARLNVFQPEDAEQYLGDAKSE